MPANHDQSFPATRWSLILHAGADGAEKSGRALDELCRTYWRPLYAYARWWGAPQQESPDLVQGFLAAFVSRGDLIRPSPEKGRFRAYLLAAFQNYLVSEKRREQAEKRGGGLTFLSLDEVRSEELWRDHAAAGIDPREAYDRRWAEEAMRQALARVEGDYRRAGSEAACEVLLPALMNRSEDFAALGERMGVSAGGARSAMHRLRQKLREALRAEVAETVVTPDEVDDEMRYLLDLLAA
ncbi:MAG: RNA polymerase sigma factor [Verrucomicrobiales bacterium]